MCKQIGCIVSKEVKEKYKQWVMVGSHWDALVWICIVPCCSVLELRTLP